MYEALYENLYECLNAIHPLSNEELLKKSFSHMTVKKGQLFCEAGQVQRFMGFVHKGLFRYYYVDKEGHEFTKHFTYENDFVVSIVSFIYQNPSHYYIEAMEDCELLVIDRDTYMEQLTVNMDWEVIARKFIEKFYYIKETREYSLLIEDAHERYERFLNDYAPIKNRIKQKYIASYLGITPESLSRIKNL